VRSWGLENSTFHVLFEVFVPFIVYLPPKWRHLANGQSGRTDRLIGFPDLAPTVLSLAGIEPPAYMQGKAFLGLRRRFRKPREP